MSTVSAPLLIGALTVIVGLFSLLNSFVVALVTQRAERRAKAVEIYEEYYSTENYRRMVLPVFRIMLKWWYLPEPKRSEYRATLRCGWVGFDNNSASILTTYIGKDYLEENPDNVHFHKTIPGEAFTEHESLTVLLYFWTKVYELLNADIVDSKTAKRLLAKPYSYLSEFIREYREDIAQHSKSGESPPWHEATQELDRFFSQ